MTWLDLGLAAILAVSCMRGIAKGLVAESLAVFGVLGSAAVALYGFDRGAGLLVRGWGWGRPFASAAAALGLFLAGVLIVGVAGWLLSPGRLGYRISLWQRMGGGVLGLAKGTILLAVVLSAILWLPLPPPWRARLSGPTLPRAIARVIPWIGSALGAVVPPSTRDRILALRGQVALLDPRQVGRAGGAAAMAKGGGAADRILPRGGSR